jgi:long-chain fatty acid transport protein
MNLKEMPMGSIQKRCFSSSRLRVVLCALGVLSGNSRAGGILIYEAGQEGNGLANAGAAAQASDPSELMRNPSDITQLAGTQISANAQVILGDINFSRNNNLFGLLDRLDGQLEHKDTDVGAGANLG